MKLLDLYRDYNVSFQTDGHKHTRDGWVNTSCPFCTGNPGLHLGATLDGKVFTCWRCGWKPASKAIAKLIGVSESEAKKIISKYRGKPARTKTSQLRRKPRLKSHRLPSDTMKMQPRHKKYLNSRNFDPEYMEQKWGLLGTGPMSRLDGIDYSHRILAPIIWNGKRVSFQTRDITNKHQAKYMGCPEKRELIPHKHILYGDESKWQSSDVGICVEGITDVWRLEATSFGTFGIKYTRKQVRWISKLFKRVIILFDDDPQAIEQAKKLQHELRFRGLQTSVETLSGDPADLDKQQAKNLIKKFY